MCPSLTLASTYATNPCGSFKYSTSGMKKLTRQVYDSAVGNRTGRVSIRYDYASLRYTSLGAPQADKLAERRRWDRTSRANKIRR